MSSQNMQRMLRLHQADRFAAVESSSATSLRPRLSPTGPEQNPVPRSSTWAAGNSGIETT